MINKSKSFTTGERRSFVTRIRTFSNQSDDQKSSSTSGNDEDSPNCNANNSSNSSDEFSKSNNDDSSSVSTKNTNISMNFDPDIGNNKPIYKVVHFVGYLRSDLNSNLKTSIILSKWRRTQQSALTFSCSA